jgi:hypothetical protein
MRDVKVFSPCCIRDGFNFLKNQVAYYLNSIFWQKNSGGVVADETVKDARTAHVKIYHDSEHASAIDLPLR